MAQREGTCVLSLQVMVFIRLYVDWRALGGLPIFPACDRVRRTLSFLFFRLARFFAFTPIRLEVTIWVVPLLIGNVIAVSFIGLLLGPVWPVVMNQSTTILPQWLLTGCLGYITGIAQSGAAVLPLITGLLSSRFGIQSLQRLYLSHLRLSLRAYTRLLTYYYGLQCRVHGVSDDCYLGYCAEDAADRVKKGFLFSAVVIWMLPLHSFSPQIHLVVGLDSRVVRPLAIECSKIIPVPFCTLPL